MIPKKLFFTKGVGREKERLASFESALRDADIEKYNIVRVSSILPPNCKIIPREKGLKDLKPGQIIFCILSECSSNEPNRLIASSVGCAIPSNKGQYGYLSEHHSFGEKEHRAGSYAEDLAARMLATTLGVDFDIDKNYDERKEVWKMSGKIVRTTNVTKSAVVSKDGIWTTVVAAAVLLL